MALIEHHLGRRNFAEVEQLQLELVERKLAGEPDDHLLLVEHEPVFTLGRGADEGELQEADRQLGIPAVRTGRGGGVTFHAPGQLVLYPVLALPPRLRDVSRYVRFLESVVVDVCDGLGVAARPGGPTAPGVWVGPAKLASIGIAIRKWIAFHGAAINVDLDLSPFQMITVCRTPRLPVTRLCDLVPGTVSVAGLIDPLLRAFRRRFADLTLGTEGR